MAATVTGTLVDPLRQEIFPARLTWDQGRITAIDRLPENSAPPSAPYILPGFVDAHVHVESSMLPPVEFARLAMAHGTVATVSDPHEIANVLGVRGVEYMIENARLSPFKFCFGAPSCVPATAFETAGATINSDQIAKLLQLPGISYLAEFMNFPGVVAGDPECLAKIAFAKQLGLPVDGHAPGLRGPALATYVKAGISTDHECFLIAEALEKLSLGMKILIREGSAARNFNELAPLLKEHWKECMFCSDDKHPDALLDGHINLLAARAVALGHDPLHVLYAACVHPVLHYRLPVGLLRAGDPADFILVEDLKNFRVLKTFINGSEVAADGASLAPFQKSDPINQFVPHFKQPSDFEIKCPSRDESSPSGLPDSNCLSTVGRHPDEPGPTGDAIARPLHAIGVREGQLITEDLLFSVNPQDGKIESDPSRDLLKITVVNRYAEAPPALGVVHRVGLKRGAIASSVAHDSHNIVAIGVTGQDLALAVNTLMKSRGGICVVEDGEVFALPLPIAGLMSDLPGTEVAERYADLTRRARNLGSPLAAPFMTLSFLALLVIPALKLSDQGLFDGKSFRFTDLFDPF